MGMAQEGIMDKDKILQTIKQVPKPLIEKAYSIDIWETEIKIHLHYNATLIGTYINDRIEWHVDGNGYFNFTLKINGINIHVIMT